MPVQTVEKVRQREAALSKKVREQGGSLEREALRELKKKLRRSQRKRRRLEIAATRRTAKAGKTDKAGAS